MLSEVLSRSARIRQIILEEEGYLLAKVDVRGGVCYAEASAVDAGGQATAWPSVQGLMKPVADRRVDSGHRLLFFRDIMGRALIEDLPTEGIPARRAVDIVISVAGILRNLHLKGIVLGYIGPESVYAAHDGSISITAGLRGVPSSHFAAPEAVGSRPLDPRSDIFALGTFLTRILSGADNHESIIRAWNDMDPDLRSVVEKMVAEDVEDRYSNIAEMLSALKALPLAVPPPVAAEPRGFEEIRAEVEGEGRDKGRRKGLLPIITIAGLAILAAAYILFAPGPRGGRGDAPPEEIQPPTDTLQAVQADTLPADTPAVPSASPLETVVWISNCTGTGGAAASFREGPARDYPYAYTSTGTRRATSVLLLRRADIGSPLSDQPAWPLAESLTAADTSIVILPVDVTILLGTDLSYPGVNRSVLSDPVSPVDTIYVDVVNQGLQYTLDGAGPATWTRGLLDGRCVELGGIEYLISVVDTRDGDRSPNEETGLPALLNTTTFLYRTDSGLLPEFESSVRRLLQAVSDEVAGPPDSVLVPDFWVLLGRS